MKFSAHSAALPPTATCAPAGRRIIARGERSEPRVGMIRGRALKGRKSLEIGNCLAASAESAIHTSLGQRPRIMAGKMEGLKARSIKAYGAGFQPSNNRRARFPGAPPQAGIYRAFGPFSYCAAKPHR
jgi:hypothetical protein